MARKTRTSRVVWLRRAVQGAFLLLFFYLFLETVDHPINQAGRGVKLFFQLDPLAALMTWLASHAIAAGMLLSVATLAVTLVFGRWFCGWICPFGTLHNFFTSLRRGRAKDRIEAGGYTRWQKAKYYVLGAFVGGALLGANVVGWLDPFSFFFRSLGTAVYPAVNDAIVRLFTWLYDVNPLHVTVVSEPIYDVLRRHFLAIHQPHYFGNVLVGVLFTAWWRSISSARASGAATFARWGRCWAWWARIRWCDCGATRRPATIAACAWAIARAAPSGRTPANGRPAECFYCFNCKSDCPSGSIAFSLGSPRKAAPLDLGRRELMAFGHGRRRRRVAVPHASAGPSSAPSTPSWCVRRGRWAKRSSSSKCIRCGECMKVCPTNAIHPRRLKPGWRACGRR